MDLSGRSTGSAASGSGRGSSSGNKGTGGGGPPHPLPSPTNYGMPPHHHPHPQQQQQQHHHHQQHPQQQSQHQHPHQQPQQQPSRYPQHGSTPGYPSPMIPGSPSHQQQQRLYHMQQMQRQQQLKYQQQQQQQQQQHHHQPQHKPQQPMPTQHGKHPGPGPPNQAAVAYPRPHQQHPHPHQQQQQQRRTAQGHPGSPSSQMGRPTIGPGNVFPPPSPSKTSSGLPPSVPAPSSSTAHKSSTSMPHRTSGTTGSFLQQPQQLYHPSMKGRPAPSAPSLPGASSSSNQVPPSSSSVPPKQAPPVRPLTTSSSHSGTGGGATTSMSSVMTGAAATASSQSALSSSAPAAERIRQCDWVDRTLWVARQLLGGNSVNGFFKHTAAAQRIKKQRARQVMSTKSKSAAATSSIATTTSTAAPGTEEDNASTTGGNANNKDSNTAAGKKRPAEAQDQGSGDELKKEILNARTAKKMKSEFDEGIKFCSMLHETIRSILTEMNTPIKAPDPLGNELPDPNAKNLPPPSQTTMPTLPDVPVPQVNCSKTSGPVAAAPTSATPSSSAAAPATTKTQPHPGHTGGGVPPPPGPLQARMSSNATMDSQSSSTNPAAGSAAESSLRRHRKKKLPPSNEPPVQLPEVDAAGKRISKKEHTLRVFEVLRYRPLKRGDFVAARLSSRDLWILARVLKDYPGTRIAPVEFLRLSATRREQVFPDKVQIEDIEDSKSGDSTGTGGLSVPRHLVLPLPRSFSEAAEWGQKMKKDFRVYAMYPATTSLYTATVVDSTTYCNGDDDIIVVEFDGDEPDVSTGTIPRCHIPARFVTPIPRDFPGAQAPPANAMTSTSARGKKKRQTTAAPAPAAAPVAPPPAPPPPVVPAMSDPLNNVLGDINLGELPDIEGFDDLDFDLLSGDP